MEELLYTPMESCSTSIFLANTMKPAFVLSACSITHLLSLARLETGLTNRSGNKIRNNKNKVVQKTELRNHTPVAIRPNTSFRLLAPGFWLLASSSPHLHE